MDRLRCATCGLLNFETEAVCMRCGRSLEGAPLERAGWDSPPQPDLQPPHTPPYRSDRPRFQDTAQAGIWDPKARYDDPTSKPPEPPPLQGQGAPYGQWPSQAQPGHHPPQFGAGNQPPYASTTGFVQPQNLAAKQIHDAQNDARNAFIASLLGLATFCCFGGLFLGIFGIVKGNEARRVLDHYGVDQGRSMAVAATIVGALDIAISIVFIVVNVASSLF